MARPTAPYGMLFAGTSLALLKLVQKLVERNEADKWLEPSESSSTTYIVETPTITHGGSHLPEPQELTWAQVIDFVTGEVEKVDLRVWLAVLLLCILGPLISNLLKSASPSEPIDVSSSNVSTQTEQEPETECTDPITVRYYHYEPAERALLQFGRSKSESMLLNYVPVDFHEPELDDVEEVVAGCTLREGKTSEVVRRKELTAEPSAHSSRAVSKASMDDGIQTDPSAEENHSINRSPLEKSLASLPSLKDGSLQRAPSVQSQTLLQLQLSPKKTSIVDVQVNPEQAYSQPFSY